MTVHPAGNSRGILSRRGHPHSCIRFMTGHPKQAGHPLATARGILSRRGHPHSWGHPVHDRASQARAWGILSRRGHPHSWGHPVHDRASQARAWGIRLEKRASSREEGIPRVGGIRFMTVHPAGNSRGILSRRGHPHSCIRFMTGHPKQAGHPLATARGILSRRGHPHSWGHPVHDRASQARAWGIL